MIFVPQIIEGQKNLIDAECFRDNQAACEYRAARTNLETEEIQLQEAKNQLQEAKSTLQAAKEAFDASLETTGGE